MKDYNIKTQQFSTFGDKLLQHTDVLCDIQNNRHFRPITVQLSPTEACDSRCSFCSVKNRDITKKIEFDCLVKALQDFKELGAKSVEITGGGNPLLYRDGRRNFNDILRTCVDLDYKIGIITNSENLPKYIDFNLFKDSINWIRISLCKLDEGLDVDDYCFGDYDINKISFSYIISNKNKYIYSTFTKIENLVNKHKDIKFVRIAPDCLTEDSLIIKERWGDVISSIDNNDKCFIKEINDNFVPFEGGCWVGMIRPYVVYSGVYICTSHVLINRRYDDGWKLCNLEDIKIAWEKMNKNFSEGKDPYKIDIKEKCWHCYYYNNNKLLESIINEMPDKDFA